MKTKLRILLVEDDVADAELITHELEAAGFAFVLTRVQTEADFRRELEAALPDIILSDHGLPAFSGFKALEIVRREQPQLPFIFVSGSNNQGMVEQMFEDGATDYVFKRDIRDLKAAMLHALAAPAPTPENAVESEVVLAQPELKLQLPMLAPGQAAVSPGIGRLWFCSRCRQARNEGGLVVRLEDYCAGHDEVAVLRAICPACARVC